MTIKIVKEVTIDETWYMVYKDNLCVRATQNEQTARDVYELTKKESYIKREVIEECEI